LVFGVKKNNAFEVWGVGGDENVIPVGTPAKVLVVQELHKK